MKIAILALQGAFVEHAAVLDHLGVDHFESCQRKDLEQRFDGLILPGGESTVMRKLLHDLELFVQAVSGEAEILAVADGNIVAAKQGNQLVTAFRPELSENLSIHRYFLETIDV